MPRIPHVVGPDRLRREQVVQRDGQTVNCSPLVRDGVPETAVTCKIRGHNTVYALGELIDA